MRKFVTTVFMLGIIAAGAYFAYPKIIGGPGHDATQQADNAQPGNTAQPPDAAPQAGNTPPGNPGGTRQGVPSGGNTDSHAPDTPAPDVASLITQGDSLAASGKILEARNAYSDALVKILLQNSAFDGRSELLAQLQSKMDPLNQTIYHGNQLFDGQEWYTVKKGDYLSTIPRHNVPYQFIGRINGINDPYPVREGQKLKIVNGPFVVRVDLSDRMLYVFHRINDKDYYFKQYRISIGKPGSDTPTGTFHVLSKANNEKENTPWTDPETGRVTYSKAEGEDFILGARWIKISEDGIGIHGRGKQMEAGPLGEAISHGCIRMRNADVKELFDMLLPAVSEVIIQP
jgi:lipoprotein-anchoring transpeptidase ErfK/SrfK